MTKKYYILDRSDNNLHMEKTGYYNLNKGTLFKTKGFKDDYSTKNKLKIIYNPEYVTRSTFDYSFNTPFASYFENDSKINTKILIVKNECVSREFEKQPIYVYLNWNERMWLDLRFKRLLVQKRDFWMWVTNVIVAIGATVAGILVAFG